MKPQHLLLALAVSLNAAAQQAAPPTSVTADTTWQTLELNADGTSTRPYTNFRLTAEIVPSESKPSLKLGDHTVAIPDLDPAKPHTLDLSFEHPEAAPALLTVTVDGKTVTGAEELDIPTSTANFTSTPEQAQETFRLDGDFTVYTKFNTTGQGTLVSRCAPDGQKWSADAKALYIRGKKLVYDIGWLGQISGGPNVNDGKDHTAILVSENGNVTLYVDGKKATSKSGFTTPDPQGHVFKTGRAASDFGGDYQGKIHNTRFYERALDKSEIIVLSKSPDSVNTPLLNWSPPSSPEHEHIGQPGHQLTLTLSSNFKNPRLQPLGTTPHARLIAGWDDASKKRGEKIYNTLCITCHGNMEQPGTLPTALVFHNGEIKNGADPFRMFQTLSRGYGQMVPQNHYSDRQKYDVIHYIRESFLKNFNEDHYTAVTPEYLDSLPESLASAEQEATSDPGQDLKPYQKMDFGPSLFWTYQVAPGNIAYKALAVRLDPGPGGVSHGKAWMVYDHDTMRVAAAYTGTGNPAGPNFVDWRGIAFDGSHGTHTSIVGDVLFTNPVGPGVAHPKSGSWDDPRFLGRDEKPYGPLPRDWTHYKGVYHYADKTLIHYTVGGTGVLELPGVIEYGPAPLFTRTLNIAKSNHDLTFRLAPEKEGLKTTLAGSKTSKITTADGFHTLTVPASATPAQLTVFISEADQETHDALSQVVFTDLRPFMKGGPPRWTSDDPVTSEATTSYDEKPWAIDDFTIPDLDANPWSSWMRLGGFDFHPDDPNKATVCTWMGDVWTVEGLAKDPPSQLTWKRIAAGLFQPLGVKIRDGVTYITCRDQIAELHDLNGDGEIDHVRSLNSDHQVTEHFHEFAMGLQTDDDGNFYYAKSARHAKTALVPHHGTLLKVSKDGEKTDILATGFRAANGVCLNPDGSFIVTDQEGHWNPKNRINYVYPGGFYGNMYGYHDVTDESDDAMDQPLCWITNSFDRSPAELLWVPKDAAWGNLNGSLLNLSYGYGKVYVVPHEIVAKPGGGKQPQGGMVALPVPQFATGVMRGRFSPADGQLYACGMFAWAGSQHQPGGFYRLRHTGGAPQAMPVAIHAEPETLSLTFTDPLDRDRATDPRAYNIEVWDLKRTKSYGSKHYDQHPLTIARAELSSDNKTVTLTLPDLAPTWGMSIKYKLNAADGTPVENELHNTIHVIKQ